MGETSDHADLVHYLRDVLTWLFYGLACAVYENLNFYQTDYYREQPLAPELAVIKGVNFRRMRSWRVGKSGPAPQVVFEIVSKETWKKDLKEKPVRYAHMGVQEYFVYDPNDPLILREPAHRLHGWQLDPVTQQMREIPLRPDGSLWSIQLQSLLVPDGAYLRLYDQYRQLCLTKAEAEERRAEMAEKRAQILAEKLRSLGIDPDQL